MENKYDFSEPEIEVRNLDLTPIYLEPTEDTPSRVIFGNSGLELTILKSGWLMNYTPDVYVGDQGIADEENEGESTKIKYALIYAAAMYEFIHWWLKLSDKGDIKKLNQYTNITNKKMHDFRTKLFKVENDEQNIIEEKATIKSGFSLGSHDKTSENLLENLNKQGIGLEYDFSNVEKVEYVFHINRLANNPRLMEKLAKLHGKCKKMNYQVEVVVNQ